MHRDFHPARFVSLGLAAVIMVGTGFRAARRQRWTATGKWLKPPALKTERHDLALSRRHRADQGARGFEEYAQVLKAGYHVLIPAGIERKSGYLAGSDKERADELNAAIRDPKVRAIFACQGGYGLTRIVDKIDYDALRKTPRSSPGFSDLTALHLAIAASSTSGWLSFAHATGEPVEKRQRARVRSSVVQIKPIFADRYRAGLQGIHNRHPCRITPRPTTVVGGKARGRLAGGNLLLLCSTIGHALRH